MPLSALFLYVSIWELLWQNNTIIAKFIILLIFGLLGISIQMFIKNRKRIMFEISNLQRLEYNLRQWKESARPGNSDETTTDSEGRIMGDYEEDVVTLYEASIEDDLQPGIAKGTMVFERLQALNDLRQTKSRVNIGVLQQLSEIQDSRHISSTLPPFVMTSAMLLGMLGTFIGLTVMVGEITAQLKGFDTVETGDAGLDTFRNSFEGIKNVMQGVGTAFTTTLVGLICTITVSVLNFIQNSQKAMFFDRFEQFTVKELLPYTFPDMEQEEVINAIKDQLRETFDKLNTTIDKNRKTLGTIDGLYRKFDSVVDTVKDVMATGGTAELHTVLQEMQGVNNNLEQIIDKYENRKLLDDFHRVADTYEGYLKKHNYILEQSKWLPNARGFMIAIASFLGVIMVLLAIMVFS